MSPFLAIDRAVLILITILINIYSYSHAFNRISFPYPRYLSVFPTSNGPSRTRPLTGFSLHAQKKSKHVDSDTINSLPMEESNQSQGPAKDKKSKTKNKSSQNKRPNASESIDGSNDPTKDANLSNIATDFSMSTMNPDRESFSRFFAVSSNQKTKKMDLESFSRHDDVKMMLDGAIIDMNQIETIWINKLNQNKNVNDKKLNEADCYEVLCCLLQPSTQSIDSNESTDRNNHENTLNGDREEKTSKKKSSSSNPSNEANQQSLSSKVSKESNKQAFDGETMELDVGETTEDLRYLEHQFSLLLENPNDKEISWNQFMHWEEIQALIADGYCTLEDVKDAWKKGVRSFKKKVDIKAFITINRFVKMYISGSYRLSYLRM